MIVCGLVLYISIIGLILFSAPKTVYDETRTLDRDSLLFHSSLKPDNYPSTKEIFQTLKDAGIEPCFLKDEVNDSENKELKL